MEGQRPTAAGSERPEELHVSPRGAGPDATASESLSLSRDRPLRDFLQQQSAFFSHTHSRASCPAEHPSLAALNGVAPHPACSSPPPLSSLASLASLPPPVARPLHLLQQSHANPASNPLFAPGKENGLFDGPRDPFANVFSSSSSASPAEDDAVLSSSEIREQLRLQLAAARYVQQGAVPPAEILFRIHQALPKQERAQWMNATDGRATRPAVAHIRQKIREGSRQEAFAQLEERRRLLEYAKHFASGQEDDGSGCQRSVHACAKGELASTPLFTQRRRGRDARSGLLDGKHRDLYEQFCCLPESVRMQATLERRLHSLAQFQESLRGAIVEEGRRSLAPPGSALLLRPQVPRSLYERAFLCLCRCASCCRRQHPATERLLAAPALDASGPKKNGIDALAALAKKEDTCCGCCCVGFCGTATAPGSAARGDRKGGKKDDEDAKRENSGKRKTTVAWPAASGCGLFDALGHEGEEPFRRGPARHLQRLAIKARNRALSAVQQVYAAAQARPCPALQPPLRQQQERRKLWHRAAAHVRSSELREEWREKRAIAKRLVTTAASQVAAIKQKQQQLREKAQKERMRLLKENDMASYMKLVEDTKNARLRELLAATDAFLADLSVKVRAQQVATKDLAKQHQMSEDRRKLTDSLEEGDSSASGFEGGGAGEQKSDTEGQKREEKEEITPGNTTENKTENKTEEKGGKAENKTENKTEEKGGKAEEKGGKAEEKGGKAEETSETEKEEKEDESQNGAGSWALGQDQYYAMSHQVREEVKQPSTLTGGDLMPYQMAGLSWMLSLYNNDLHGILADEMGLGKTIQTIALLAYLKEFKNNPGPHLIIVPLSTLPNWADEFRRWCPSLKVVALKHLVVDEGHRMKNSKSKFHICVSEFRATHRLLLTGTPLQNNLAELWSLLNFLLPKIFSCASDFEKWFSQPFEGKGMPVEGSDIDTGGSAFLNEEERLLIINRLHAVLRPFLLRRVKKDVLKDMPERKEYLVRICLSEWQKAVYKQIQEKGLRTVDQVGNVTKRGFQNTLMQLRKIANHPYLFVDEYLLNEDLVRVAGKFECLDRMLPKLLHFKHKVLIFSQMTQVLDLMAEYMHLRGYKFARLDGSVGLTERKERMAEFNNAEVDTMIFMLSTRAGGLGLNLQAADTVILFDSDFNPHQDLQAMCRAHRLGQTKQVKVFRLVTISGVEEIILEKANRKLNIDQMVIQAGMFDNKSSEELREEKLRVLLLLHKGTTGDTRATTPLQKSLEELRLEDDQDLESAAAAAEAAGAALAAAVEEAASGSRDEEEEKKSPGRLSQLDEDEKTKPGDEKQDEFEDAKAEDPPADEEETETRDRRTEADGAAEKREVGVGDEKGEAGAKNGDRASDEKADGDSARKQEAVSEFLVATGRLVRASELPAWIVEEEEEEVDAKWEEEDEGPVGRRKRRQRGCVGRVRYCDALSDAKYVKLIEKYENGELWEEGLEEAFVREIERQEQRRRKREMSKGGEATSCLSPSGDLDGRPRRGRKRKIRYEDSVSPEQETLKQSPLSGTRPRGRPRKQTPVSPSGDDATAAGRGRRRARSGTEDEKARDPRGDCMREASRSRRRSARSVRGDGELSDGARGCRGFGDKDEDEDEAGSMEDDEA
ncbi:snf2 family N-terminal domain-containing protein, related [Neospora caninum Liverpool]|uniref:Snf2 family N-terminal domain-containing protein, related n=1 Tax=Neospora caninum (strain Liverpool) TaxID=572307 RepID=F0VA27_NEOCL|nr:snf2 family N-terminal domain-containing protein, related [Neospora caninum Liverpool]CBZ50516.1 snf2 family N-terminal domain-containing protein, related [Neospora caninum Liverpool]|eukprot:XP_003880549.1 snf2 family N-terminal domain-containing protein, related [Neospora caninum Liverpool]